MWAAPMETRDSIAQNYHKTLIKMPWLREPFWQALCSMAEPELKYFNTQCFTSEYCLSKNLHTFWSVHEFHIFYICPFYPFPQTPFCIIGVKTIAIHCRAQSHTTKFTWLFVAVNLHTSVWHYCLTFTSNNHRCNLPEESGGKSTTCNTVMKVFKHLLSWKSVKSWRQHKCMWEDTILINLRCSDVFQELVCSINVDWPEVSSRPETVHW